MTVLVLGGGGILGSAFRDLLPARGIESTVLPRAACDVRDAKAIRDAIDRVHPSVLVNASGYTRVDEAEDDREACFAVNGVAPGLLARRCREASVRLVHVSTDFVFPGDKESPYTEDDVPSPLSVYGQSKLLGEREVSREGGTDGDWLIVRTSWHYGPGGQNFVRTIYGRAREGAPLQVVDDQRGCPTYSGHLADAILALVAASARGLFHYADRGELSWYDLARAIVEVGGCTPRSLEPCRSDRFPRKARRPPYSVLSTAKYERATGRTPPPYERGLRQYLEALAAERAPAMGAARSASES